MESQAQHNFSDRSVVVFGAGYLGSEVARRARALGARVLAVTRNPATVERLRTEGLEAVVCDLTSGSAWHGRLECEPRIVVNCIGSSGGTVEAYRASYLDSMAAILGWCEGRSVDAIVYSSSTSVYTQGDGARIDESSPAEGGSEQARILAATERLLLEARPAARRRVVLRLAGLYGPGRHQFLDSIASGAAELAGDAQRHLNLIHRDDAAEAVLAAAVRPGPAGAEVYNLCDDGQATRGEIAAWLAPRLGLPIPRFNAALTQSRRQVADRVICNTAIKRALGWAPRYPTFREGFEVLLTQPET